jgi:Ribbon-helix-helix protein, copG family
MQTDRLTILLDPAYKAAITRQAAARGVSTSEHVRNALDSFGDISAAEEADLRALAEELNTAMPAIQASLVRANEKMEALHADMDAFFKFKGLRK